MVDITRASVDKAVWQDLVELCSREIPGFVVCYKDESFFQKVIGLLVRPFNPDYMTRYTSTFYPKVYFPSRKEVEENYQVYWKVLAHEYVHLWDNKNNFMFPIAYLFPQILSLLALLAIGAIWSPVFWMFLGFLFCLMPLPAPFRVEAELRGYYMNMAVNYWRYGTIWYDTKEWIVHHFTGAEYYKMSWDEIHIRQALDEWEIYLKQQRSMRRHDDSPFVAVFDIIHRHGLARAG